MSLTGRLLLSSSGVMDTNTDTAVVAMDIRLAERSTVRKTYNALISGLETKVYGWTSWPPKG